MVHIPKTGGTTLGGVLNRTLDGKVFWLTGGARAAMERISGMPPDEVLKYQGFSGHLPLGLHQVIPGPCEYAVLMRDPVDRLVSHYYHLKGKEDHYLHDRVIGAGMTLEDYATCGKFKEVDNLQTRMIAGIEITDRFPAGRCDETVFEQALANLEQLFCCVGVQDLFDESVLLFHEMCAWTVAPFYRSHRVNATRPRNREISDELRRAAEQANRFDVRLYWLIRGAVAAAVEARGDEFQHRLGDFRSRNEVWAAERAAQTKA
jgi:hypothetical protein